MTGYRSKFFRHKCPESGCYIEGLPCWDQLIESFPRKIRPTDVDGFVEINGSFLFLEEKSKGVAFGNHGGQFSALKLLSRLPGVTVAYFREGEVTDFEVLILDGTNQQSIRPCSKNQFFAWLHNWTVRADSKERAA